MKCDNRWYLLAFEEFKTDMASIIQFAKEFSGSDDVFAQVFYNFDLERIDVCLTNHEKKVTPTSLLITFGVCN